jgi:hypothetical protein
MLPEVQLIDESLIDLPSLGINRRFRGCIFYHIYPGDFQYSKNLSKVDYSPISGNINLNGNVKYHRGLDIVEGVHMRSVKLITNLKPFNGRYLSYEDTNSEFITKL